MRRLLIPLDGTELAASILCDARRLAGPDGTLILVENAPAPRSVRGTRQANTAAVDAAGDYLTRIAADLEADGARIETHVLVLGDPASAVDQAALLYGAAMVAVATHGRGPLGRLVRGSTAWKALAHSPVPVLLRHAEHSGDGETVTGRRRVLVPLDGSDYAERALPLACEIAAAAEAELILVQVIPVIPGYVALGAASGAAPSTVVRSEQEVRAYLGSVAASLPYPACTLVLTGPVSGTLIDAVRTLGVTDIVLASHGRTGLSRVVLGSVTDDLVQHLHCPIVIVPALTAERVEERELHRPTGRLATPTPVWQDVRAAMATTITPLLPPNSSRTDAQRRTVLVWMRHHSVISYFVIAFAVSWAVWIPMALAGARVYQGQAWPNHIPGLFGPMTAAFIMSGVVAGVAGVRDLLRRMVQWRVSGKYYLAALSPLAFYAGAVITLGVLGQGWPDFREMGKFSSLPLVAVPVMALLLLGTSYGEESGWRGFAVPEMLKSRGLLSTAIVIGLLWTLWHVPSMFVIENYRQMGIAIIPMFTLGVVSGSILLAWLYRESGGSVLIVAIWHACYNLVSGTAAANGVPAAVVSVAVMVWAVLIVISEGRRRRREQASQSRLIPVTVGRRGHGPARTTSLERDRQTSLRVRQMSMESVPATAEDASELPS